MNSTRCLITLLSITCSVLPVAAASDTANGAYSTATAASKPAPTWQEYLGAVRTCKDKEQAKKYQQAAILTLSKSFKQNPMQKLSGMDHMKASVLCVHMMYVDGSKIIDGPDGSKIEEQSQLEELVQDQEKNFGAMQSAYKTLKQISPGRADQVAFELKKCSEFMAKTKANLEKAQQKAQ
jgi:hypothetical protein